MYNKPDNLDELLNQICPDICMVSESWQSEWRRLSSILQTTQCKYISCYRKNGSPGGGCAKLYNETNLEIDAREGVESIWELFTPKSNDLRNLKVKRTAVFFLHMPEVI